MELECSFAAGPIRARFSGEIEMGETTHGMEGFDLPISQLSAVCGTMSIRLYPAYQRAAR